MDINPNNYMNILNESLGDRDYSHTPNSYLFIKMLYFKMDVICNYLRLQFILKLNYLNTN